jgi:nitroreductase
MDLTTAIYQRRAVRDYTDAHVDNSTIDELLNAAVQAPSSLNQQPWAFGVFQGKERLKVYSDRAKAHYLAKILPPFGNHERGDTLTEPSFNIFYNANTLIVIYAFADRLNAAEDCCLAAQTLMLAAHGMGLGTCPIGIARPWLNIAEVKNELEIPTDLTAAFSLTLGQPAGQPKLTTRKAPDVVFWNSTFPPHSHPQTDSPPQEADRSLSPETAIRMRV